MILPLVFVVFAVLEQSSGDTNIAKDGKVTQSSVDYGGVPERAVDGNKATNFFSDSCTHTKQEQNPWWRLDLQKKRKIKSVTVTLRGDCCHNRIFGAEIRIGNSLKDNGNTNPRCAVIRTGASGSTNTFVCNGMEGQYINIVVPGNAKSLTLCEVEVAEQEKTDQKDNNIAKGGKVAQSSVDHEGSPERAVDGSKATDYFSGSCTHTKQDKNPWWRLDLQKKHKINTVTVTVRGDCCHDRINGAEIRIGNSLKDNGNTNPRCAVIASPSAGSTNTFNCNGMEGQYINIVIPTAAGLLTLCEVEVTGQPSESNEGNIATNGKASQSSVDKGAGAKRAIDGNGASDFQLGSCSATKKQQSPWWKLDLLKPYKVGTVTVTIQSDCCHERMNGAEIRIGNSPKSGNANPRCGVISSPKAGEIKKFDCNGMEGQYVIIAIPGRKEQLTLCEVEVTEFEPNFLTENDCD